MSEVKHHSHIKQYVIIFVILALLTVLELFIPGLDTKYSLKAGGLVLLAVAKAVLVGYYYMHLNEEKKWLQFIALIPISAVIYAVVLMLESNFR